jgi:hypothetical protein
MLFAPALANIGLLFGPAEFEIMSVVESLQKQGKPIPVKLKEMFPSREEWRRSFGPYGRGP